MAVRLVAVEIRTDLDVVLARKRTRQIAECLGFDARDQTRIATAVSEIARNALQYAVGGRVEFFVNETNGSLEINVTDRGPGIADLESVLYGDFSDDRSGGMGIVGARRLMETFDLSSDHSGTQIKMSQRLPLGGLEINPSTMAKVGEVIATDSFDNPLEEMTQQNQALLSALEESARLNRELEETNRGVLALYAELEEKADSLQRASQLKSRFLSNMSHEFRTPLNSILSLSRFLLDKIDGDLTSEQEKQVRLINHSAQGLSELVNDLLDLAKVESGKVTLQIGKCRVSDLLGALRGMFRPLVTDDSVKLHFTDVDDLPDLETDETKLAQILRNFLTNAVKFTEKGEIHCTAALAGGEMEFAVRDTGIGIAEENLETIFEEFNQVDHPIQRHLQGTGLGLPLCRKLAELLGGRVSVTSELGQGSTFSLRLPLVYHGSGEGSWHDKYPHNARHSASSSRDAAGYAPSPAAEAKGS